MKVMIANYTGTVGKTTMAVHLLSPRMQNARIFAIETINETAEGLGVDVEKIKGEKFKELYKEIMLLDDAIIDVGASNVEAFLDGMLRYEGSQFEFDYFVIPVTSGTKEQKETIAMVNTLAAFNIAPSKIRILFNRVQQDVSEEFGPLIKHISEENKCTINLEAVVYENELFDMLQIRKMRISDALEDERDYRALARALPADGDPHVRATYTAMHLIKSLSLGVNRNLDRAFNALFAE